LYCATNPCAAGAGVVGVEDTVVASAGVLGDMKMSGTEASGDGALSLLGTNDPCDDEPSDAALASSTVRAVASQFVLFGVTSVVSGASVGPGPVTAMTGIGMWSKVFCDTR
jgi:hypothetical protein